MKTDMNASRALLRMAIERETNLSEQRRTALCKMVDDLGEEIDHYTEKMKIEQQMFCDVLNIEFADNPEFNNSYTRKFDGMVADMESIKCLVFIERQLRNMNDEFLFARVTIIDTDPEY